MSKKSKKYSISNQKLDHNVQKYVDDLKKYRHISDKISLIILIICAIVAVVIPIFM